MEALARVLKPGFALTLEPRRFLDFIREVTTQGESPWHRGLASFAPEVPSLLKTFDAGNFVYLPTGGGDYRPKNTYGDAVVPIAFIEKHWSPYFDIVEYLDDPRSFWQAVLVVRRK
jgi:hypothetical protein